MMLVHARAYARSIHAQACTLSWYGSDKDVQEVIEDVVGGEDGGVSLQELV